MPAFDIQSLPDFGETFFFARNCKDFVGWKQKGFLHRLKLITPIFRQFLNDITKFWTAFVAGASRLPLAAATASLGVLATATDEPVFLVLMSPF
jgi:hypothetical protein